MAELKNLQKLQRLFNLMDDDSLTKEQFVRAFKKIMELQEKAEAERNKAINKLAELIEKTRGELSTKNSTELEKAITKIQSQFDKLSNEHAQGMNMLRDKVRSLQDGLDGEDGKDADEQAIFDKLVTRFEAELKDFDPTDILAEIDEMQEEIDELKKRPVGKGGSLNDKALQYAMGRMIKTETPSGTIDGANDTFTVTGTIHAVLSFELNSRVIDFGVYSITGGKRQTIVFDSAPAASYSGKQFNIVYI